MANTVISKQARRAAREAAVAAQDELVRRTRANVADLATFFSARERVEAVDGWLKARQQVLRADAERRRREQRVVCGRALAAMRDRGESVREIARMADVSEKQVRDLMREAEAAADSAEPQAQDDAAGATQPPAGADVAAQRVDESPAGADGAVGEGNEVPAGADGAVGEGNEVPAAAAGDAIRNGAAAKPVVASAATA